MESTTTTTTSIEAQRAIEERGVARHVAAKLVASGTPDLIGAWAEYGSRHTNMGPGALVNAIRSGNMPPSARHSPTGQRAEHWERMHAWLREHLPELCDEHGHPHQAAISAFLRMELRYGRGNLSVHEHGQAIRGAVKDAISDPQSLFYEGEL